MELARAPKRSSSWARPVSARRRFGSTRWRPRERSSVASFRAGGIEAESSLSFAALSDLLGPVFDDIAPALPGPRRRALEVVLLLAEPGDAIPDPLAIGLAVLDALRALSSSGPCVLALDDIQWLDAASAAALQVALRRLDVEPVAVLATFDTRPDSASQSISTARSMHARLTKVDVGPLDLAAVHRLLRERVALDLTRPELVRLHSITQGNPFFALEVGREMARSGTRPTSDRVDAGSRDVERGARRPTGAAAVRDYRRAPGDSRTRVAHGGARHGRPWRPRNRAELVRGRRRGWLDRAGRRASALHPPASRIRVLPAGAHLEAPGCAQTPGARRD